MNEQIRWRRTAEAWSRAEERAKEEGDWQRAETCRAAMASAIDQSLHAEQVARLLSASGAVIGGGLGGVL